MHDTEWLSEMFKKYDDEFLKFESIESPANERPDLCAFLILDQLAPGSSDMVTTAEHDKIYLEVEPEDLAKVITESDIRDLIRCGIMYDEDENLLWMFV